MRGPESVLPRHVRACQHSKECRERWYVWTWKRDNPDVQTRVPYSCNSWRCEVCRRHEAAVTFARFKQAVMKVEAEEAQPSGESGRSGWCFLVLTLDRDGYFSGKPWTDVNEAYRSLSAMTTATLKRIGRLWGASTRLERSGRSKQLRTVRTLGNRWVAVVEAHRSGWPHVNLVFWCPELAELLRSEAADRLEDPELADAVALARDAWKNRQPVTAAIRERARRATVIGGQLAELITGCGWGLQSTAEAARSIEAVIGYGVKLAGLHDSSVGELAKVTQCPMNAPIRFRRLRSGKGFLPPRVSNPEVTGCLLRRRQEWGDWRIQEVNPPKDEAQIPALRRAIAAELALIAEERDLLRRSRAKRLPPMPPMRVAIGGALQGHVETSERRAALGQRQRSSVHDGGAPQFMGDAEHAALVEAARARYRNRVA